MPSTYHIVCGVHMLMSDLFAIAKFLVALYSAVLVMVLPFAIMSCMRNTANVEGGFHSTKQNS